MTFTPSPLMSEIEATLKQQISRETLSQQVSAAYGKLHAKRLELIGLCSLMTLTQAGFSDGEDWSTEDEIRARALGNSESLIDRVAAELPHMSRAEIEEHEDWWGCCAVHRCIVEIHSLARSLATDSPHSRC